MRSKYTENPNLLLEKIRELAGRDKKVLLSLLCYNVVLSRGGILYLLKKLEKEGKVELVKEHGTVFVKLVE